MNHFSIVSLVFGIFSILLPVIGLFFGGIGLIFGKKSLGTINHFGTEGRGITVGGIVCSIIGIGLQVFVMIGFLSFYTITSSV